MPTKPNHELIQQLIDQFKTRKKTNESTSLSLSDVFHITDPDEGWLTPIDLIVFDRQHQHIQSMLDSIQAVIQQSGAEEQDEAFNAYFETLYTELRNHYFDMVQHSMCSLLYNPNTLTNQLHLAITTLFLSLIDPIEITFADLVQTVLPTVRRHLEWQQPALQNAMSTSVLNTNTLSRSFLQKLPPDGESFKKLLIVGDTCFFIEQISQLSVAEHRIFFQALRNASHSTWIEAIQKHNRYFSILYTGFTEEWSDEKIQSSLTETLPHGSAEPQMRLPLPDDNLIEFYSKCVVRSIDEYALWLKLLDSTKYFLFCSTVQFNLQELSQTDAQLFTPIGLPSPMSRQLDVFNDADRAMFDYIEDNYGDILCSVVPVCDRYNFLKISPRTCQILQHQVHENSELIKRFVFQEDLQLRLQMQLLELINYGNLMVEACQRINAGGQFPENCDKNLLNTLLNMLPAPLRMYYFFDHRYNDSEDQKGILPLLDVNYRLDIIKFHSSHFIDEALRTEFIARIIAIYMGNSEPWNEKIQQVLRPWLLQQRINPDVFIPFIYKHPELIEGIQKENPTFLDPYRPLWLNYPVPTDAIALFVFEHCILSFPYQKIKKTLENKWFDVLKKERETKKRMEANVLSKEIRNVNTLINYVEQSTYTSTVEVLFDLFDLKNKITDSSLKQQLMALARKHYENTRDTPFSILLTPRDPSNALYFHLITEMIMMAETSHGINIPFNYILQLFIPNLTSQLVCNAVDDTFQFRKLPLFSQAAFMNSQQNLVLDRFKYILLVENSVFYVDTLQDYSLEQLYNLYQALLQENQQSLMIALRKHNAYFNTVFGSFEVGLGLEEIDRLLTESEISINCCSEITEILPLPISHSRDVFKDINISFFHEYMDFIARLDPQYYFAFCSQVSIQPYLLDSKQSLHPFGLPTQEALAQSHMFGVQDKQKEALLALSTNYFSVFIEQVPAEKRLAFFQTSPRSVACLRDCLMKAPEQLKVLMQGIPPLEDQAVLQSLDFNTILLGVMTSASFGGMVEPCLRLIEAINSSTLEYFLFEHETPSLLKNTLFLRNTELIQWCSTHFKKKSEQLYTKFMTKYLSGCSLIVGIGSLPEEVRRLWCTWLQDQSSITSIFIEKNVEDFVRFLSSDAVLMEHALRLEELPIKPWITKLLRYTVGKTAITEQILEYARSIFPPEARFHLLSTSYQDMSYVDFFIETLDLGFLHCLLDFCPEVNYSKLKQLSLLGIPAIYHFCLYPQFIERFITNAALTKQAFLELAQQSFRSMVFGKQTLFSWIIQPFLKKNLSNSNWPPVFKETQRLCEILTALFSLLPEENRYQMLTCKSSLSEKNEESYSFTALDYISCDLVLLQTCFSLIAKTDYCALLNAVDWIYLNKKAKQQGRQDQLRTVLQRLIQHIPDEYCTLINEDETFLGELMRKWSCEPFLKRCLTRYLAQKIDEVLSKQPAENALIQLSN